MLIALAEWADALVQLSRERHDCELAGDHAGVATVLRERAQVSNRLGDHEEALERYREAEVICRTLGLRDEVLANLWGQRYTLRLLGRVAEARQVSKEAADITLYRTPVEAQRPDNGTK